MQYLVFYVNEIAGWHTNVSVNGSEAFLPLQGNPLGWHGLIQWEASWMTHSGEACRIVEETIPDAGVHFVFSWLPFKNNTYTVQIRDVCIIYQDNLACSQNERKEKHWQDIQIKMPPLWFWLSPLSAFYFHILTYTFN